MQLDNVPYICILFCGNRFLKLSPTRDNFIHFSKLFQLQISLHTLMVTDISIYSHAFYSVLPSISHINYLCVSIVVRMLVLVVSAFWLWTSRNPYIFVTSSPINYIVNFVNSNLLYSLNHNFFTLLMTMTS